jgi:hypothetical protein
MNTILSEGVDGVQMVLVRGWTLSLVRVETFICWFRARGRVDGLD